mmetsp:Transcript_421/g.600  ORF Transcript_421/g.600 Transcript_421/m.600 type:complete len:108 (-) Transcript_421:257-580(-)
MSEVHHAVPIEVFADGLEARKVATPVAKKKKPEELECSQAAASCEKAFRSMRDAYVLDCREQAIFSHRCSRLSDLINEVQDVCEVSYKRCKGHATEGTFWQMVGLRR